MMSKEKVLAFIETTFLHTLEGEEFGLSRGEIAGLMLVWSVGVYGTVAGKSATVKTLRTMADTIEAEDG